MTNEKDGDAYEWVHPSGQPVGSKNLLQRYMVDDLDFGEYRCTVWRADSTSELRTVRVNEKLPKRASEEKFSLKCNFKTSIQAYIYELRTKIMHDHFTNAHAQYAHMLCQDISIAT